MRIVYQSSAAFSRFERAANAELLSVVIVLKIAPMCSLYSFKSVSKAAITLLADLSSSLTILNSLVLRSKRVRRASSWPNFAPITGSHSPWPNSFRSSTSLGLSSILRPSFRFVQAKHMFLRFSAQFHGRIGFLIFKSHMSTSLYNVFVQIT